MANTSALLRLGCRVQAKCRKGVPAVALCVVAGSRRQGKEYRQSYRRGRPQGDVAEAKLPRKEAGATGTQVRFLYDRAVFSKGCARLAHLCANM